MNRIRPDYVIEIEIKAIEEALDLFDDLECEIESKKELEIIKDELSLLKAARKDELKFSKQILQMEYQDEL